MQNHWVYSEKNIDTHMLKTPNRIVTNFNSSDLHVNSEFDTSLIMISCKLNPVDLRITFMGDFLL